jgi:hypothetical protein
LASGDGGGVITQRSITQLSIRSVFFPSVRPFFIGSVPFLSVPSLFYPFRCFFIRSVAFLSVPSLFYPSLFYPLLSIVPKSVSRE